ncbi:MAG: tetratricopeptide repeat protein [Bacteroidales bacterium]|nr:tetratricopeptide repeat protein [Bacteroidales bacterium]
MKKIFCIFLSLFFTSQVMIAQNQYAIDSLEMLLENNDDKPLSIEEKKNVFLELAGLYWADSPEKILESYQSALILAQEQNNKTDEANIYKSIGTAYLLKVNNYEKAIENYTLALNLYFKIGDTNAVAACYNNIGVAYKRWGQYDLAIQSYLKQKKLNEETENQKGISNVNNNIGNIYHAMKEYDNALRYYKEALMISRQIHDTALMANPLTNLGAVYQELDSGFLALEYFNQALMLNEAINDNVTAIILSNMGYLSQGAGDIKPALEYYERALKINEEIQNRLGKASVLFNIGALYNDLEEYDKAHHFLTRALNIAKEIDSRQELMNIYNSLFDLYFKQNDCQKALKYHILYAEFKDSIYSETSDRIADYETKYKTEIIERQLIESQFESEKKDAALKNQRLLIFAALFILLIIIIFSVLLLRQFNLKKNANILLEEQNLEINKQKEEIFKQARKLEITNHELEKLSIVASETDNAIIIANSDGEIEWVNDGFTRLYGYSLEEYKQNKNSNIFNSSSHPDMTKLFEQAVSLKESVMYLSQFVNKFGKTVWTQTTLTPIFEKNNNVRLIVAIDSDITQLKHVEEQLVLAKNEAEKANKVKSEFLANMSHEIRTPMNAVLGFADLLGTTISDHKQKSYVDSIKSSGKSLMTLINDILDLSKIEAGKLEIQYAPLNLKPVLREIEQIFSIKILQKNLEFISDIDPNIPDSLILSEARLRQVLFNIIGNAIKFTDIGYIKLKSKIIGESDDKKKIELLISVEDTGIGVPKSQYESIFKSFEQQDGQDEKKYGGTGLGLAISKRLVNLMGGEIKLKSEVGKGSIFEILLHDVYVSQEKTETIVEKLFDYENIHFEEATILVADDNLTNRNLIKEIFEKTKIKTIFAEDGQEAIIAAREFKPDLILMDIRMPIMDGFEAVKVIRQDKSIMNIPVIALTASVLGSSNDLVSKKRFNSYLMKPTLISELFYEVCNYLKYKRKKVGDETEARESDIILTDNIKENLAEIINVLEKEFLVDWKNIKKNHFVHEIIDFGTKIKEIGSKYSFEYLENYGNNLVLFAKSFDIVSMDTSLNSFPDIVEKLKTFL